MLSTRRSNKPPSTGSCLTGVAGGDASRNDMELALDIERAMEREEVLLLEPGRVSEFVFDPLTAFTLSRTRSEFESSAVKNCRIWSLRLCKSSRVRPIELSN